MSIEENVKALFVETFSLHGSLLHFENIILKDHV